MILPFQWQVLTLLSPWKSSDRLKKNIINDLFVLTEFEINSLNAFQAIRLLQPESFEKLATRLKESLSADQRILIGKFLTDIAFYDNILTANEQKALKKAFNTLDIDVITSDKLIAEALSSRNQENPVIIQKGIKFRKGEILPQKIPANQQVVIDQEKLRDRISRYGRSPENIDFSF